MSERIPVYTLASVGLMSAGYTYDRVDGLLASGAGLIVFGIAYVLLTGTWALVRRVVR